MCNREGSALNSNPNHYSKMLWIIEKYKECRPISYVDATYVLFPPAPEFFKYLICNFYKDIIYLFVFFLYMRDVRVSYISPYKIQGC